MLDFHPITLEDKPAADAILMNTANLSCEYAFGNLFIWRHVYRSQISLSGNILIVSYQTPEGVCYSCPQGGGDFEKAVSELLTLAEKSGRALRINDCSKQDMQKLQACFPDRFDYSYDDGYSDYVYAASDLANLVGRKYHDKRNHISIFERTYPDWSFEVITKNNIGQCAEMNERWLLMNEQKDEVHLSAEHNALNSAMAHYDELGFFGGLIRADKRVVAFSFGERLNADTFCVHFEKAFANVNGAYPIICREMARRLQDTFTYLNREEDTGTPGLRRAKQSYRPVLWLKKYSAIEKRGV